MYRDGAGQGVNKLQKAVPEAHLEGSACRGEVPSPRRSHRKLPSLFLPDQSRSNLQKTARRYLFSLPNALLLLVRLATLSYSPTYLNTPSVADFQCFSSGVPLSGLYGIGNGRSHTVTSSYPTLGGMTSNDGDVHGRNTHCIAAVNRHGNIQVLASLHHGLARGEQHLVRSSRSHLHKERERVIDVSPCGFWPNE